MPDYVMFILLGSIVLGSAFLLEKLLKKLLPQLNKYIIKGLSLVLSVLGWYGILVRNLLKGIN